jgi:hypothetical protein
MLHNELTKIPHITLLRSDKVLHTLIQELIDSHKVSDKRDYNIRNSVKDFYPNRYRLDEIELSINQDSLKDSNIEGDFDFKFLDNIFDEFYDIDGSKIYAKENNLENYVSLITKIMPYHIIGYKLANLIQNHSLNMHDIVPIISKINPLGYKVDQNKKFAENHIHLKGVGYTPFHLVNLLSKDTKIDFYKEDFINTLPRINEFSTINNKQYSIAHLIDIAKLSINYIYSTILDGNKYKYDQYISNIQKTIYTNQPIGIKNNYSIDKISQMTKLYNIFDNSTKHTLLEQLIKHYKNRLFDKVCLVESILLFMIFETSQDTTTKIAIKIYLQINNILRSYMLMSQNLGLSHFSEFNRSAIRDIEKNNTQNTAQNIIQSGTNYINAKLSTSKNSKKIQESISRFKYAFDIQSKDKKFQYNFCLSVVKEKDKSHKIKTGNNLVQFSKLRTKLKKQAHAIDDFLRNTIYKNQSAYHFHLKQNPKDAFENKEEYKKQTPYDISKLVVSIDAVGKETHTPPEVFAPFFRYLRRDIRGLTNNIFKGIYQFEHHKNLLITTHAGEDFNHIITGIRRVEESIKFFGMKKGDRLGHALSIGIRPKDWLNSIGELIVTKGEYFDNLVWLVYSLNDISKTYPLIHHYVKKYETQALTLFAQIYPNYTGATPQIFDLYKAWELRSICPITYFERKKGTVLFDDYSNSVLTDKEYEQHNHYKSAFEIFELYQRDQNTKKEYEKSYYIDKSQVEQDEINMWECLQDYIINKCAKTGIIIEVNPSSNIFISALTSYQYHPIYRWSPIKLKHLKKGKKFNKYGLRDGKIDICINSDDPSIFATTLQNEFNILQDITKKQNYTDKQTKEWLEEFRQFGIKIFKESYSE